MTAALTVWWRLRQSGARENRVPGILAVVAFAVSTAALLVCLGGLDAFQLRNERSGAGGENLYVSLALVATGLMLVPILTLGAVAARLAIARRDQRMAALRLTGATSAQVATMTLAEAAVQAVTGAVAGVALYAVLLAPLSRLTFQGRQFEIGELWVGPLQVVAVVVGVVLLSVVSGISSLAKVVISPLGVANRTTPARLSIIRVVVAVAVLVAWIVATGLLKARAVGIVVALLVGVVAAINLVGPFVVMLFGHVVARSARGMPTLLAARRIIDDPRSTWRAVGALGLGVLVAGLSTVMAGTGPGDGPPSPGEEYLGTDIATGSLLTLAIIAVVAATSTGVVQAARVLDQQSEYRALALAGTDLATLHRARTREVSIPLAVTVALSAGFTLMVFVPFAAAIGPALVVRFLGAVGAACGLMLLAVTASRSLVRQACALT